MSVDESFGIRDGYAHRHGDAVLDDAAVEGTGPQDAYERALTAATLLNAGTVVDVGCGSGANLLKYFSHLRTIGLDLGPRLDRLRKTDPDRDWRECDFSADLEPADVVICADVIERLPDPDRLMAFLNRLSCKALVLSTHARELVHGDDHAGPPANPARYREWTLAEFKAYVSRWFTVLEGGITDQAQARQTLICLPRPRPAAEPPSAPPSVLAIVLEFDVWTMARSWAYANSYALVDGLQAAGCDVVVLPSLKMREPNSNPWIAVRDAVLQGRTFDQVWIWVTHSYYEPGLWRWLETIAPIRVGVLMESLLYDAHDIAEAPILANRKNEVYAQLGSLTHVITADDTEATMIATETGHPTRAYLPMLPRAFLTPAAVPVHDVGVFLGTLYGKRLEFLKQNATLDSFVGVMAPPEQDTDIPQNFDRVTAASLAALRQHGGSPRQAATYVTAIRQLRRDVVRRTVMAYNGCLAGVALPAMFKGVTGRVVEIMAAAVPPLVPHAAASERALPQPLVDGENVLCYDPHASGDLERQIRRLKGEPGLRERLVAGARATFETELCCEAQIAAILRWIAMS